MSVNKSESFRYMSDKDLANYYVEVSLYREKEAIEQQKEIREVMVDRFVEKYADTPIEPDCDNCLRNI